MAKTKFSGRRPGKSTEWAEVEGKPIEINVTFERDQPPRYGPSGYGVLIIEPAHNGLIVRTNHQERHTMSCAQDFAVFTSADEFGRWMTEHFRNHLRNVVPQKGGATCIGS